MRLIMTRWRWLGSVSLHRSTESCGVLEGKTEGAKRKGEIGRGEEIQESREVLPR